ncbi:hypothetical protein [Adlercreutzia sp. ZJ176]|uniref:hypothetical protein n=1 Tax=Adlercreutzia sp. ZJ176 TaxID=2709407 RepID=UPI0013EDF291|nr:hypothetical protein [Adlercreutzia sp. ZJ176]
MSKILLLGPSFFGYRDKIAQALIKEGNVVDCFVDRPSESIAFKSAGRVSYRLVEPLVTKHARDLETKLSVGEYDRLVYLSGMSFCFSRRQFSRIRSAAPRTKYVAGLWDALGNCQRFGECLDLFDEVYSFEPDDCDRFRLRLRPLFYLDDYARLPLVPEGGFTYDACFIGSVHQASKFEAICKICEELEAQELCVFKYFFIPSRSAELLRKMTYSAYRGARLEHSPLSAEKVAEVYARSRAIIDSPQAGQRGLTIRTLEAVGARRKLITTNPEVLQYDFSRYGDVAVWDRPGSITRDFFSKDYQELPPDVYKSYSITSFAATLLGEGPTYSGYKKGGVAS